MQAHRMAQHAGDARCHWVKNPLVHARDHMHVTERVHDMESRISQLACVRSGGLRQWRPSCASGV